MLRTSPLFFLLLLHNFILFNNSSSVALPLLQFIPLRRIQTRHGGFFFSKLGAKVHRPNPVGRTQRRNDTPLLRPNIYGSSASVGRPSSGGSSRPVTPNANPSQSSFVYGLPPSGRSNAPSNVSLPNSSTNSPSSVTDQSSDSVARIVALAEKYWLQDRKVKLLAIRKAHQEQVAKLRDSVEKARRYVIDGADSRGFVQCVIWANIEENDYAQNVLQPSPRPSSAPSVAVLGSARDQPRQVSGDAQRVLDCLNSSPALVFDEREARTDAVRMSAETQTLYQQKVKKLVIPHLEHLKNLLECNLDMFTQSLAIYEDLQKSFNRDLTKIMISRASHRLDARLDTPVQLRLMLTYNSYNGAYKAAIAQYTAAKQITADRLKWLEPILAKKMAEHPIIPTLASLKKHLGRDKGSDGNRLERRTGWRRMRSD